MAPARRHEYLSVDISFHKIHGPTKHVLDGIPILSRDTIALVNPVDDSSGSVESRVNIATTTLHILRKLDHDLSVFRASSTIHSSPLTTPPR